MSIKTDSSGGKEFIMKDSPPDLINATGVVPRGRKYDTSFSEQPGAVRAEDIVIGMKYASLAITDDKADTLKEVGKGNPWHIEALKIITGSEEEAHKPLSKILSDHMGLTCDQIIDVNGVAKNGQMLDTQGYIAHNDEVIVLAYRCTTSAKDWLTNLSTTSSAWEPEEDLEQGHSGYFSGLEGLCCYEGEYRPRVHTGFYNNFLSTLPYIKKHIEPLLAKDQPPRKLYVVGHSLGAGIATMAACYFICSKDWAELPHKLIVITAGSPRACQKSMYDIIKEEMARLRPLDKAVICRIVRDRDCVPALPPSIFGFKHLEKLVYITDEGDILINPKLKDDNIIDEKEMKSLIEEHPEVADDLEDSDDDDDDEAAKEKRRKSKYEKVVSKVPRPFRDHMPDFYLKPLIKLFENETGTIDQSYAEATKSTKGDEETASVSSEDESGGERDVPEGDEDGGGGGGEEADTREGESGEDGSGGGGESGSSRRGGDGGDRPSNNPDESLGGESRRSKESSKSGKKSLLRMFRKKSKIGYNKQKKGDASVSSSVTGSTAAS